MDTETKTDIDRQSQLIAHASAQTEMQFRVFCSSVQIRGRMARFIRWDPAGVVVTAAFDYVMKPDLLAQFFWRYNHMDLVFRGHDPSVCDASGAGAQETCSRLEIPSRTRTFSLRVPDDSLGFNGDPMADGSREYKGPLLSACFVAAPTYTGPHLGGNSHAPSLFMRGPLNECFYSKTPGGLILTI
jgi:hypothetical protein